MRTLAQTGTYLGAVLFCLAVSACDGLTELASDAGSHIATHDASCQPVPCPPATPWNAAKCACAVPDGCISVPEDECQKNTDCALIARGCCASCLPPSREQALAVPVSKREQAQHEQCPAAVACGPCELIDPDPLAPLLVAACVEHRCALLDLRDNTISSCASDSDCAAVGRGCCPPYSEDPAEYVGIHDGADTALLACFPVPPCVPPQQHATPTAYCAGDGHCAVRRRETLKGQPASDCYSPTQNLEHAYDSAAVGCDCKPGSAPLCRADKTGRRVALLCLDNGQWQSEEDGPCSK